MNPRQINIDQFDYSLPDERIAKFPLAERDRCRLLVHRADGHISTHLFSEVPDLLPPDATLIYNNTRVINARLRFRKESGALIEVFCLEPKAPADYAQSFASKDAVEWLCFVGNSKRWKTGELHTAVNVGGSECLLTAERIVKNEKDSVVRLSWTGHHTFAEIIAAAGELPIPPYLNRSTEQSDSTDYQTIFSRVDGSVAAPTAGLHFTPSLLAEIDRRGIGRREITLHVGAGTFQPVQTDNIGDHAMHSEFIAVSRDLIRELASSRRPVIAVGTTSVRTLESLYHLGCRAAAGLPFDELPQWYPYDSTHPNLSTAEALSALADVCGPTLIASTRLLIAPGYKYRIVKGIITNFHQPRSTLLLLVSAFVSPRDWRPIYNHALDDPEFRFLSYGDACLFLT